LERNHLREDQLERYRAETARSAGCPTANPGADTDEVARELGYPTEDIARLRTVGIV
jgi:crotonobetainyl-CoA:carnitine CoA-transferase CaiB-like acyl-CoA transferase